MYTPDKDALCMPDFPMCPTVFLVAHLALTLIGPTNNSQSCVNYVRASWVYTPDKDALCMPAPDKDALCMPDFPVTIQCAQQCFWWQILQSP